MPAFFVGASLAAIVQVERIGQAAIHGRISQKAYFRPRLTLSYFWLLSLKRPL